MLETILYLHKVGSSFSTVFHKWDHVEFGSVKDSLEVLPVIRIFQCISHLLLDLCDQVVNFWGNSLLVRVLHLPGAGKHNQDDNVTRKYFNIFPETR